MLDIVNDTKVNHMQSLPGEKSRFNETISKNQMAAPATGVHTKNIVLIVRRISCFPRTLREVDLVAMANLLRSRVCDSAL